MNSSRDAGAWQEIDQIFQAAISLNPAARPAFLSERCSDADVRQRVERLLLQVDTHVSFLRTGGGLELASEDTQADDVAPGKQIRGFRLIEVLGEGGMGEVWKAEQTEPVRRFVALKLIKPGMDSRHVVARFTSERQALALMSHQCIARVYDGGVSESGRPFFVMELVKGVPIVQYCDENRLATRKRLELFCRVCEGVQHAHHKGVIHRDIKPSNVLVTTEDGPAVPKIIDFGIARATDQRLTESTLHTKIGEIMGTPGYMSPEQFEFGALDVDTRTDVYSLGAVLYELLTSMRPFEWDRAMGGYEELRKLIREKDPTRPSTRIEKLKPGAEDIFRKHRCDRSALLSELRGDLDWITMKALEKDRTARYDSPHELAEDIRRYLESEPVIAGPRSRAYRFSKFAQRNRTAIAVASSAAFGLVAAGVTLTYSLFESQKHRETAEAALVSAEQSRAEAEAVTDFLSDMMVSATPKREGLDVTVREIVERGAATIDGRFADQPMAGARLRSTMGLVYNGLGLFDEARPLHERALELAETAAGGSSTEIGPYLTRLAGLYQSQGKHEKSRTLFYRALDIFEDAHGPDDPSVALVLVDLSSLLTTMGERHEAAELLQRSIRIYQTEYGDDSPHVAVLQNNVAVLLTEAGEFKEARKHCEQALAAFGNKFSPTHPWVLTIRGNIADLHMAEGEYQLPLPILEDVLALREEELGPNHLDLAHTLTSLGELRLHRAEHEAAMIATERSLAIRLQALGADHPHVAASLRVRGAIHEQLGDLALARQDLERALEIAENTTGVGERSVRENVERLVEVLRKIGDQGTADRLQSRYAEVLRPE